MGSQESPGETKSSEVELGSEESPGEIKSREVELGSQKIPGEIKNREVELGSQKIPGEIKNREVELGSQKIPGEIKSREVELCCHSRMDYLADELFLNSSFSGTVCVTSLHTAVETAISEVHKLLGTWLLNSVVLAVADGRFGLSGSERADELFVPHPHPHPPSPSTLP